MPLGPQDPVRLVNRVAYHLHQRLGRWGRRVRPSAPAAWSLELADAYRLDAHLALTLTRLGTVHTPARSLRALADCLDVRSYLRVLARQRSRIGPATVRLVEAPAASAVEPGRSLGAIDDYYNPPSGEAPVWHYPYPMHPWTYALGWHRRVARLRHQPRRWRLFFAGVVHEGYAERFDFPILTRPAIIEAVVDAFRADTCVVTNRHEARQIRRTDRPIVVVALRGAVTPMASNHFLSRRAYLQTLARSEFALCPPGVFMPHSHNLVEALAVGTVPVLNYPEFCRPRLVDGASCLAFRTTEDLAAAVRRALTMPPHEVAPLRTAVVAQYDRHYDPAGAAQRLLEALDRAGGPLRVALNREFNTARAWSRAQAQAAQPPGTPSP